jgi:Na+/H+-dicarboxylate symporter
MAIDPILDMMRTATNVAGQALVPVIVAAREQILDHDAYNSATSSPIDDVDGDTEAGTDAVTAEEKGTVPVPA